MQANPGGLSKKEKTDIVDKAEAGTPAIRTTEQEVNKYEMKTWSVSEMLKMAKEIEEMAIECKKIWPLHMRKWMISNSIPVARGSRA